MAGNDSKQFTVSREEIDQSKHEMHLQKMKLAALAREDKGMNRQNFLTENHKSLFARYKTHRKNFENLKKEFSNFEEEWLK